MSERADLVEQAYRLALRWLGRRDYTRYEIERRLRAKGFEEPIIAAVVQTLEAEHWLSDARVEERLLERLTEQQPSGHLRIAYEFERRGLTAPATMPEDELSRALEALRKRFGVPPQEADAPTYARWYRFLLRRGFEPEIAERALRQWHSSQNE